MKDSNKIANRFAGNGGSGGIFNELSLGYKYFLGKKRIIGFRHSLFSVTNLVALVLFLAAV
ncbi:outer membrane family protein [Helicobacter pylori SouthAfrica50]|uniref:Outer membrane family protein n=1 Tax=Helicobacter pylori SouthAfrica50 TaxID=1352357 RepID=T2S8H1_HELPX|nr:outer membrane family protein [Helicobacter pylori SouthAfrica50]